MHEQPNVGEASRELGLFEQWLRLRVPQRPQHVWRKHEGSRVLGGFLLLFVLGCSTPMLREEDLAGAEAETDEEPDTVDQGLWLLRFRLCRQENGRLLHCRGWPRKDVGGPVRSLVEWKQASCLNELGELYETEYDRPIRRYSGLQAIFAGEYFLIVLDEQLRLKAVQLNGRFPPEFPPTPVIDAVLPFQQTDLTERSACFLGNGTFACFALPLASYFFCPRCPPRDPDETVGSLVNTGQRTRSERAVYRPDFEWRSRAVDWKAFDGANDLDNDGLDYQDSPLCALDAADGTWRCGLFNAFVEGLAELEPVRNEDGELLREGVQLRTMLLAACMLDQTGTLWCRGKNELGMLGDGVGLEHEDAVRIDLPGRVVAFDMSEWSVCAQLDDLSVYCWGYRVDHRDEKIILAPTLIEW